MSREQTSRADGVRRVLLTASLVLAPLLIATGSLLTWQVDFEDRAAVLAEAVEQPVLWQVQSLITMAGFMLLVPAGIAAAELVRRRRPGWALASVILIGAGAMMIVGAVVSETTLAAAVGVDPEAMLQFDTQIEELGAMVAFFPLFFAGLLGLLLLAVGLWRSKATPLWVPVVLAASIVVVFFADQRVVTVVAEAGLIVAFAGIAWSYRTAHTEPTVVTIPEAQTTVNGDDAGARPVATESDATIESGS